MIVLSGADLVLPDRILSHGTIVIDGSRIVEIRHDNVPAAASSTFAFHKHFIVPGFIDVHVHGVEGVDTLDAGEPVAEMAARLPKYGVTAFCPTTVACPPGVLRGVLAQIARGRESQRGGVARILPAHLESNFINVDFRGAQPAACLRTPRAALLGRTERTDGTDGAGGSDRSDEDFDAADILREIERAAADVGVVTLAPELDGALGLIEWLTKRGHRVSLGHSGADYDEASAAISAGARRATHLFNRMPPLHHRSPGLAGAVLESEETAAELICDGVHVHPAMVRAAVAAKHPSRLMAITDGTAVSATRPGTKARLGGQTITASQSAAFLDDGTLAGSALTMDGAFRMLVDRIGLSPVDAVTMCSTTPARELGLVGHGMLVEDGVADLAVLDQEFRVVQTYVAGQLVYSRRNSEV